MCCNRKIIFGEASGVVYMYVLMFSFSNPLLWLRGHLHKLFKYYSTVRKGFLVSTYNKHLELSTSTPADILRYFLFDLTAADFSQSFYVVHTLCHDVCHRSRQYVTACYRIGLNVLHIGFLIAYSDRIKEQESCAIAKMTAQCALHMGALKIFGTPWLRPRPLFSIFSEAFVPVDAMNVPTKFEVRSFTRCWDNRGYPQKIGQSLDTPTLCFLKNF